MPDRSVAKQDLSLMLEGLLPEQQALLARRLLKKKKAASVEERAEPAIPIVADRTNLPLSFGQQRLWFIDQLEPNSPLYNLHLALSLEGPLDVPILAQALGQVIGRHEVLRTTFTVVQDQPVQVIGAVPAQPLTIVDLTHCAPQDQQAAIQRHRSAERLQPFDLARGPLLRVALLKLSRQEHVLLVTLHHIIADRWSIAILLREWIAIYTSLREGRPPAVAPLPIQYADFAAWQRRLLQGATLDRQLGYWQQQLAQAPVLLDLATDYPRPAVQSFRGNIASIEIDARLADAIKRLSHQAGTTLFMTLLAAFAVLLSRYSREEDLVIGSPIANRTSKAIEPLIGFFINTLALRVNVDQQQTFLELLRHVRNVTLDALTHQDVPFEQVVDALNIERSLSYNPLFQVMFDLRNADVEQLDLAAVRVTTLDIETAEAQADSKIAKFDLTLTMVESAQGLSGDLEYNVDLFRPATIERMIEHFQALLAAMVAQPDRQLYRLSCITEAERQAVLLDWNATRREYDVERSIHALFAAQVAARPDAPAVVFAGEQLSYAALDARAARLAQHLHTLGVGPETRVGVCVERSPDM
ncbi:MAG TPA: condensation domain-containing protein, partial [Herpetosiphonaceae bacterium]